MLGQNHNVRDQAYVPCTDHAGSGTAPNDWPAAPGDLSMSPVARRTRCQLRPSLDALKHLPLHYEGPGAPDERPEEGRRVIAHFAATG